MRRTGDFARTKMINCPGCGQKLPDTFVRCQFCGADVAKVPRPVQPVQQKRYYEPPKWVLIAYYGIAIYWLIGGGKDLYRGLGFMSDPNNPLGFLGMFSVIVGGVTCIIAIGLLLKLEWVRAIVNFFNFLKIAFGLMSLWGLVTASLAVGPIALLWIGMTVLDIATAVLMIYLIGETDRIAG